MATNVETMWVADEDQLLATVQTLVNQHATVRHRAPGEVQLFLKKRISVPVLIGGLLLCPLPGLVYLAWYLSADQDQEITVKVGTPPTVRTHHQLWPDDPDAPAPTPPPEGAPSERYQRGVGTPEPRAYPTAGS